MTRAALALLLVALATVPARALDLPAEGAVTAAHDSTPAGSVRLPERPWVAGTFPPQAEGAIARRVLQFPGSSRTTLQLLQPFRDALDAAGYDEVFTCADDACGGFDFRFQLDILGEPEMHVDLGDYRYVLARKTDPAPDEPREVSLVASRAPGIGFVHITEVFASLPPDALPEVSESVTDTGEKAVSAVPEPPAEGLIDRMTATGSAVLDDLDFASGSADLGPGPYASLKTLADWLAANPAARVILVGHTDATGSLDANTAVSRQRAASVADRLTGGYSADPAQIASAGAGYLAPRASNLTPEGRAMNRRVEVVLLSLK